MEKIVEYTKNLGLQFLREAEDTLQKDICNYWYQLSSRAFNFYD
jgi:hypothetical protein